MRDAILDIRENLREGRYANEAAVSRGIVLRILNELARPIFEPTVVAPEFSLSGTRVDYALCHPTLMPVVLLEVKQVGLGSNAERQLFGYAVHHGVPMAILTTGQEWHFFLPGERGDYNERRVYMLDLLERDPDESAARLQRYLSYRDVCSGRALEAAKADYRDVAKNREIQRTLPEAWNKLIEDEDDFLLELVSEKVESLCGYKPGLDVVARFLTSSQNPRPILSARNTAATERSPSDAALREKPTQDFRDRHGSNRSHGPSFVLEGVTYPGSSGRDVMTKCLQMLADRDGSFVERFSAKTRPNKKRRYLARSKHELYPSSPHLAETPSNTRELISDSGWWIDLNLSKAGMEKVIKLACEVAGLKYGADLVVNMD